MNQKKSTTTDKNKFNFYISYWESYQMLEKDSEKVEFIDIINRVHFFEVHIDEVCPKSNNVKLLFASIKHSLKASIQGYCDKKEIDYNSMFDTPLASPLVTPLPTTNKEQLETNKEQLETNNQEEKPSNDDIDKAFSVFYENYGVKKSKQKALAIFKKLKPQNIQKILDVVQSEEFQIYQNSLIKNNGDFRKHPTTWLNAGGWEDDLTIQNKISKPTITTFNSGEEPF